MSSFNQAPHQSRRRVPFPLYEDQDQDRSTFTTCSSSSLPTPSNHFLAQRPTTTHTTRLRGEEVQDDGSLPDTSTLAAADFDVSVETGFLPPQEPVQSLKHLGNGWKEMEDCLERVGKEVEKIRGGGVGKLSHSFRESVKSLPRVDCSILTTLPLLRRAHTLLAHLVHYYMHSSYPSQTVVPSSLSIPLVYVSEQLGIPPILTYADTVLWVWKLSDPTKPLSASNVKISTRFTRSKSEEAFFLLSLFCELKGPKILRLMSSTLDETFFRDRVSLVRIAGYLENISVLIDELTSLLKDAVKGEFGPLGNRQSIEPSTFYWEIRPWFNGGKWFYEGVGGEKEKEMEWGGPSAGQSSLVHAIDLFLGIDHSPRRGEGGSGGLSDSTFMQRMSTYMPRHHRSFLQHLVSIHSPASSSSSSSNSLPSLRSLVVEHPQELQPSYDRAVLSMKRFRDSHIILATHFIVSQARHSPSPDSVHFKEWETKRLEKEKSDQKLREEAEEEEQGEGEGKKRKDVIVGTGGTDLSKFLKLCRDRTKEALIEQQQP